MRPDLRLAVSVVEVASRIPPVPSPERVERLARFLCQDDGFRPDEMCALWEAGQPLVSVPMWQTYTREARRWFRVERMWKRARARRALRRVVMRVFG